MSIPNVETARVLNNYIRNNISLRLFSNNITPDGSSTLASFTQVTGGGYVAKTLLNANWVVTPGDPSDATYPQQTFTFTGPTGAPSVVYGYYLVDLTTGLYIGGSKFPDAVTPLTPVAGSKINFTVIAQAV